MSIINKISEIVSKKLSEDGFEDCYIVEIKIDQNSKVKIFIDCDSGVPIRKCVSISRRVEQFLDNTLLLGEKYTLEVSSPGIGRPLIKRQYKKNIGRDLKIILNNDKKIKGTLNFVDETGIILEIKDKKEFKKEEILFSDIKEAKIIVNFNKNKK